MMCYFLFVIQVDVRGGELSVSGDVDMQEFLCMVGGGDVWRDYLGK